MNISFDDYLANPMFYAKYFYFKDLNGLSEYNGNTYTLLEKLIIPSNVLIIGKYQFCGFERIKEVIVHKEVKQIGFGAFSGCSSINSMTIPFAGAGSCESNDSKDEHFGYIFGCYEYSKSYSAWKYFGKTYYIPNSLKKLEISSKILITRSYNQGNFRGCRFKTLILSLPMSSFFQYTFYECESKNIVIPKSLKYVGYEAFPKEIENVYFEGTVADWKKIVFESKYSNPMRKAENFYYAIFLRFINIRDFKRT